MVKALSVLLLLNLIVFSSYGQLTVSLDGKRIHFGTSGNPLSGLTITWYSPLNSNQFRWGYTEQFEQGQFSPGARNSLDGGYYYDFTFPTLNPLTTVYYAIYDTVWSATGTFQTSRGMNSDEVIFTAGGDSHVPINTSVWEQISGKAALENSDFHLMLGDHVSNGLSTSAWNTWFSSGQALLRKKLVLSTVGNHDYQTDPFWTNHFFHPNNELWYSFEMANTLFICLMGLESMRVTVPGIGDPEQYAWLVSQLQNTTAKWKVVFFHRPFFTPTQTHRGEMDTVINTWWKAFDDYGVDLTLSGHVHYYMRSKPINLNKSNTAPVDEYGSDSDQGRLEIISGGMGNDLSLTPSKVPLSEWFVDNTWSSTHYVKVHIKGDSLKLRALTVGGTCFDSVTLYKSGTNLLETIDQSKRPVFNLYQNYPNPFFQTTIIKYHVSQREHIVLKIYNLQGQEVSTLINEPHPAGTYTVTWDGTNASGQQVGTGTYFYRLTNQSGYPEIRKMTLIR